MKAGEAGCSTSTFDLSTYSNISYEAVTPNTGSGNSYARDVDGGCNWIKETSESGGESNTSEGESYALSATQTQSTICNDANQTFSASTLITITPSNAFPITYTYGYSVDNVFTSTDSYTTLVDNDASTITISGLQAGYYNVLLQPSSSGGCNEFRLTFRVVNPILSVTPNYELSCSGGVANFELSNPDPSYFSMSYTRTYSIDSDLSTTDGSPVTGMITSSTSNPDISFSNLAKGYYRVELDPSYGCNKIVDFEVKEPLLTVEKNFGLECTGGTATFEVTNSSPETYFPVTYTRIYSATSSNVADMDQTLGPITVNSYSSTPDISFADLPAGYYRLIIDPTNGCNDTTTFQILEPVPNISTNYTLECSGGTASFEITSTPLENYFPFNYTRIFSVNSSAFSTIDETVTGTINTSTATPDLAFQNLMPGYYRLQIFPPNGCTRTINFEVIDTLLRPITPFTTTLYCAGGGGTSSTSYGSLNITFSNPSSTFSNYLPINYNYYETSNPSVVYSGTSTSTTDLNITGLMTGTFSLNLIPAVGCSTDEIEFTIEPCPTLTQSLKSFTGKNKGIKNEFNIEVDADGIIDKIHLQSSKDGRTFAEEASIPLENKKGLQEIMFSYPASERIFYRLELHDIYDRSLQSAVIKILYTSGNIGIKTFPNPAGDYINLSKFATKDDVLIIQILSNTGKVFHEERLSVKSGYNKLRLPTNKLPKGQFIISMFEVSTRQRQSSTFMKY